MENGAPSTDYVGEFVHQLDARNRVTIPSSWRVEGDGDNYYLAWPHADGCVAVYPPQMQREFLEKARGIKQSDRAGQQLLRRFFGKAHRFGLDKAGRILIPEALIQSAGIVKEVVLVGMGVNFQLWSRERYRSTDDEDFNLLETMQELGI